MRIAWSVAACAVVTVGLVVGWPASASAQEVGASAATRVDVHTRRAAGGNDAVPADDGPSDHEAFVGRFAIGYLGVSAIPLGGGTTTGVTQESLSAPVIGARYWLNRRIGIDAGLGLALASTSGTSKVMGTSTDVNGPSPFGLALHGGVPIALAAVNHFTFEVIPEVNIAFAKQTDKSEGNPDVDRSGFRLDVGARAGAEIHFGFIHIPQLSLQATVGLALQYQSWKISSNDGGGENSSSVSSVSLGTSVQSDPWALFTNNVSALYYF